ncbi:glycosyltransferase family 4 protein [Roseivirga pacifica]
MSKKICMLLHEFYPNDIRVSKETSALIKAGFEIHLICLARTGEASQEQINGIFVHRLSFAQTFFWRGIWDILLVAFNFVQPRFLQKLKTLHEKENFDAIHVHDLPLTKTALKLKSTDRSIKVIADFHENYPEALKVWFQWKANPIIRLKNNIFFDYNKWMRYEKKVCEQVDRVVVVVEEMKDRLKEVHGIDSKKVCVVTNSEAQDFLNQKLFSEVYDRTNNFILAYTGNVGPHRGVDTIVESLQYLKEYKHLRLEITGKLSGNSEQSLKNMAKALGVESMIRFNGYQPFEKFFSYMKFADVNLIPHKRNGHTDNTIPHKLYQGMMVGKPVLVSDAPPLKRVVNELNSGLVFEANNAEDAARKIETLLTKKELCAQLGQNGKESTTNGKANWEHDSLNLTELYSNLLNE